jgi:hypothetical protein
MRIISDHKTDTFEFSVGISHRQPSSTRGQFGDNPARQIADIGNEASVERSDSLMGGVFSVEISNLFRALFVGMIGSSLQRYLDHVRAEPR